MCVVWYLELQGVCVIGAGVKVSMDAGSATEAALVGALLPRAPCGLLTRHIGLSCRTT